MRNPCLVVLLLCPLLSGCFTWEMWDAATDTKVRHEVTDIRGAWLEGGTLWLKVQFSDERVFMYAAEVDQPSRAHRGIVRGLETAIHASEVREREDEPEHPLRIVRKDDVRVLVPDGPGPTLYWGMVEENRGEMMALFGLHALDRVAWVPVRGRIVEEGPTGWVPLAIVATPFTVALDAATLPIQAIWLIVFLNRSPFSSR